MLYQLIGPQYLRVGDKVDIGTDSHMRWGIIAKVIQEDYKLHNPCVASGTRKFYPQIVNLFLIRGGNYNPEGRELPCVWGWRS